MIIVLRVNDTVAEVIPFEKELPPSTGEE